MLCVHIQVSTINLQRPTKQFQPFSGRDGGGGGGGAGGGVRHVAAQVESTSVT